MSFCDILVMLDPVISGKRNHWRINDSRRNNINSFWRNLCSNGVCECLYSTADCRQGDLSGPGQIALSAVGSAVEALAHTIAAEIAPKRINVVSPGIIDTPMVSLSGDDRIKHYQNVTKTHLIRRPGNPAEVATSAGFPGRLIR